MYVMRTKLKTPKFGDEQGVWIMWMDGEYHPFSIRAWDRLLHKCGLNKMGHNRWGILK
jgi:hypothetical protein